MQDSERGCAADRERSSVAGSSGSVKRRSRRRWSAEQKLRIVGESLRSGTRVEDVARRYEFPAMMLRPLYWACRSGATLHLRRKLKRSRMAGRDLQPLTLESLRHSRCGSVLVRLAVRRHELRAHQRHPMTISSGHSTPVMRTAAGFHRYSAAPGHARQVRLQSGPAHPLAFQHRSTGVDRRCMKYLLRQVDPDPCYLVHAVRSVVDSNDSVSLAFEAARMKRGGPTH